MGVASRIYENMIFNFSIFLTEIDEKLDTENFRMIALALVV